MVLPPSVARFGCPSFGSVACRYLIDGRWLMVPPPTARRVRGTPGQYPGLRRLSPVKGQRPRGPGPRTGGRRRRPSESQPLPPATTSPRPSTALIDLIKAAPRRPQPSTKPRRARRVHHHHHHHRRRVGINLWVTYQATGGSRPRPPCSTYSSPGPHRRPGGVCAPSWPAVARLSARREVGMDKLYGPRPFTDGGGTTLC
jgi:hypothetical protein